MEPCKNESRRRVRGQVADHTGHYETTRSYEKTWTTICRVAFYENPQEFEKLGVLVLNGPRHAAKGMAVNVSSRTP